MVHMCTRQINHFRKISKSPKKGTHTGGYAIVLTTQMFQKRLQSAVLGTKYMTPCESSPSERKKDTCLTWAQGTLDGACGLRAPLVLTPTCSTLAHSVSSHEREL